MLPFCPIIVDNTNARVIDGQLYRLWVARKLKSNIFYVISDEIPIQDVAKMNKQYKQMEGRRFSALLSKPGQSRLFIPGRISEKISIPIRCMHKDFAKWNSRDWRDGGQCRKIVFERGEFEMKFEQVATRACRLSDFCSKNPVNTRTEILSWRWNY